MHDKIGDKRFRLSSICGARFDAKHRAANKGDLCAIVVCLALKILSNTKKKDIRRKEHIENVDFNCGIHREK